jgi:hypothetical protein
MITSIPREWDSLTAFVIGGGPSVVDLGHDRMIARLEGRHPVIAINNAYLLAPWADVLYWADNYWLCDNWRDVGKRHVGWYRITRQIPRLRDVSRKYVQAWIDCIKVIQCKPVGGISFDPSIIYGRNGGHHAINIAALFGASRIVLIGFDMHARARKQNWHDLHSRPARTDGYQGWIDDMNQAASDLRGAGIHVLNANRNSALRCFDFVDLADVI